MLHASVLPERINPPPLPGVSGPLQPLRLRLGMRVVLHWSLLGLALALAGLAVCAALAHWVAWSDDEPYGGYARWYTLLLLGIVVAIVLLARRQWPSTAQAARRADGVLSLKDRLTTALEFSGHPGEIFQLQRADLLVQLQTVDLRRAAPNSLPRREIALVLAAALVAVGVMLAPNPQSGQAAVRRHDRQATQYAAQQAANLSHRLSQAASDRTGTTHDATQTLRQLENGLRQARTTPQALKAISAAQQQLQTLAAPGAAAASTLQALASSLASGQTKALARALAAGDKAATQRALASLKSQIPSMPAAKRNDLAHALQRAANAAQGALGAQLRQAAFNLTDNNASAAQRALDSAGRQIAAAQSAAQSAQLDQQMQRALQSIKQGVANGQTSQSSVPQAQSGGAQQQGQGASRSTAGKHGAARAGGAAKQGNAKSGQGRNAAGAQTGGNQAGGNQAAGSASARASAAAGKGGAAGSQASGNGGTGAAGRGKGGGAGSGNAGGGGQYETIYLPGKLHGGPEVSTQGPPGAVVPLRSSAFRALLPRYTNEAQASLGRTALPPDVQSAVKRYFQSLEQE